MRNDWKKYIGKASEKKRNQNEDEGIIKSNFLDIEDCLVLRIFDIFFYFTIFDFLDLIYIVYIILSEYFSGNTRGPINRGQTWDILLLLGI